MTATTADRCLAVAVVALVLLAGCPVDIGSAPQTERQTAPLVASPAQQTTQSVAGRLPSATPQSPCERTATPEQDPTPTQGSPEPSPEPATPPAPTDNVSGYAISVEGTGSVPFDVNRTYARTLALLDVEVAPPTQLYLQDTDAPWRPTVRDGFAQTLIDARERNAFTGETRTGITLSNVDEMSRVQLQYSLVHEFVHHVQFRRVDESTAFRAMGSGRAGVHGDAAFSIVEGSASYVALEYVRTYTNLTKDEILAAVDEYRGASPAGKYVWGPYHFGRRYVEERVDSPAAHWRVYENPPRTTEELIHALDPGSEPVAPLSVSLDAANWSVSDRSSRGELFVRSVLTAELSERRAARDATGWGNDRVLHVETGDGTGYAWALRFDDATDADEFVRGVCAAMDERTERSDGVWVVDEGAVDVDRIAPETAVVTTGPASFVRSVTLGGDNETVSVTRE